MTGWDGRGTPPGVRARLAQVGPVVSHLDVAQSVQLESVGLSVVGEVIGYVVQELPAIGVGLCRAYGPNGQPVVATVTSGDHSRFAGFAGYVDALYRGYDLAIARLTAEAVALGADGVVGVDIRLTDLGQGRQFSAVGTAVTAQGRGERRAESEGRPRAPFVTDLDAGELTGLLLGGWVPVSLAIGLSIGVRHEDPVTARQRRRSNRANGEIDAGSELVRRTREDARQQLANRAKASGAGNVIVSSMATTVRDVGTGHRDLIAECRVFGSTVLRFGDATEPVTAALPVRRGAPIRRHASADDQVRTVQQL